jgi:hypothetical protein
MEEKNIILLSWKTECSYNDNSYKINKISEINKNVLMVKSEIEHIKIFIEHLKDMVLKTRPNLNAFNIKLGVFDKNNKFHTLFILAVNQVLSILNMPLSLLHIYKTIFVIIYYENECVFTGGIGF